MSTAPARNVMMKYIHIVILSFLFCIPNAVWNFQNHVSDSSFTLVTLIDVLLSTLPYFCISFLLLSLLPGIPSAAMVSLSALAITLLSWLGLAHAHIYGSGINGGSIYIALNSNIAEIGEYLKMYGNFTVIAHFFWIFCIETVFIIYLFKYRGRFHSYRRSGLALSLLLLPLVSLGLSRDIYAVTSDNLIFVYHDAFWEYSIEEMKLNNIRGKTANQKITIKRDAIDHETRETYVLILGESISKRHMSLYGYSRDTNPLLTSISGELLKYDHVTSAGQYTVPALQTILTFANRGDRTKLYQPHILQIMKAAGFRIYWLSNQNSSWSNEHWIKYFSETADIRLFTNASTLDMDSYDELLLAPFSQIVRDSEHKKKFIVVHLMGAHVDAKKRYPPAFEYFTNGSNSDWINKNKRLPQTYEYINSYDNAIRYDDFIVYRIIEKLRSGSGIRLLFFVPDHGEEVGEIDDFIGRRNKTTRFMFEIPFLVWMSPEYRSARRSAAERAKDAVHRSFQTDGFIHSFMDFSGIWTDGFLPDRSIINRQFIARRNGFVDGSK